MWVAFGVHDSVADVSVIYESYRQVDGRMETFRLQKSGRVVCGNWANPVIFAGAPPREQSPVSIEVPQASYEPVSGR